MAWLLRDGQVLASLEIAESFWARARGLGGHSSGDGGMLLEHSKTAHSLGARFAIDVAWLDGDRTVIATARLRRLSVALPRFRAQSVLEAEAGAFGRWQLAVGDRLEIKR
ncbi:MAG: DUF192 domain-containing protein [Acidimicrobiales bacterium]